MTLDQLWARLRQVRSLSFIARSAGTTGWNGTGTGTVDVQETAPGILLFHESGTWLTEHGKVIRFGNVYRWALAGEGLRLEHLRFGADNPVYLFDLAQTGDLEWRSTSPHLCREDCYSAVLRVEDDRIVLRWSVDGPHKREMIEYVYTDQEAEAWEKSKRG
jgi:hypothetical protein